MDAKSPSPESSSFRVQPPVPAAPARQRRGSLLVVAVIVAAVALLTGVSLVPWIVSSEHGSVARTTQAPNSSALQLWWAQNHDDVEALGRAIDDAEHSLATRDAAAVAVACQQMHDIAELDLKARLPAPEPSVTSDLSGAVEDSHAAAHMCLAAESGTSNNYSGEFRSNLDQAERQLRLAQNVINHVLAQA